MARQNRKWYPGATCHVMSRGNRKTPIFKEKADYLYFLELLDKVRERYPCKYHSICLMTNHFHIVLETGEVELGKIMSRILSRYAVSFNNKYSFSGHVFEGRYKSSLIEDDIYFLEVSRYIHLNPVKAKMVRNPLDYEYSSYELFVSDEDSRKATRINSAMAGLVDTSRVLSAFGSNRDKYRLFVEGKISHAEQELLIMKDMNEDEMWLPW